MRFSSFFYLPEGVPHMLCLQGEIARFFEKLFSFFLDFRILGVAILNEFIYNRRAKVS